MFLLELIQIRYYGGFKRYIMIDPWNIEDLIQFAAFIVFYILNSKRDFEDERKSVYMTIFSLSLFILAYIKIMYFMRLFKQIGSLV